MDDQNITNIPDALTAIERETVSLGFDMASDRQTGAFLRTLVASKPSGKILELGTGTGLATSWILDGMGQNASLVSIDIDQAASDIASRYLGSDPRVEFHVADANSWLVNYSGSPFDLVFADAMAGKYENFQDAWENLKVGGLYIIDDMLPQDNWPVGHESNVERLLTELDSRPDCQQVRMNWSSGLIVMVRS